MDSYKDRIVKKIRETVDSNFQMNEKGMNADQLQTEASSLFPGYIQKINNKIDPNKQLKIEFIDSPVITGYVDIGDRKTIHVHISHGMMNFVYKMIKLFLSRMAVCDDERVLEESKISQKEMLVVAENLMRSFWEGDFSKVPGIDLLQLNKGQIELGAFLLHYSECFIVAHELGHTILVFCPEGAKKELYIAASNSVRQITKLLESLGMDIVARNLTAERWSTEFAADLLGLELCLQERDDPIGRSVIRASAELVLIAMQMLEKYYLKKYGQDYLRDVYQKEQRISHPPSVLRWEFIHAYIDPRSPQGDVGGLGLAFKQFSDFLLGDLQH
jgi:hypothetical protein